MSEIFAVQLTAVATAVLAAFAFITAILAYAAFRKQSREVRDQARMLEVQRNVYEKQTPVLEQQATELLYSIELRKREAEQLRNGQASLVFVIEESSAGRDNGTIESRGPSITVIVQNTSNQPVYDAEFWWHRGFAHHGHPNPESIGTILPGAQFTSRRIFGSEDNLDVCGALLRFRDATGVRWERRADGFLGEQSGEESDYAIVPGLLAQPGEPREIGRRPASIIELLTAQLQRSLEQRELDVEEQRRSQAARVSAWFGLNQVSDQWGALIRNASDLPVTNVRTVFYKVDKDRPDSRAFPIRALTVENLPPQQDWFNKIPLDGPDLEIKEGDYTVSIAFTDAAGNRWERDPLGTLNLQS